MRDLDLVDDRCLMSFEFRNCASKLAIKVLPSYNSCENGRFTICPNMSAIMPKTRDSAGLTHRLLCLGVEQI